MLLPFRTSHQRLRVGDYRSLLVWRRAHDVVKLIYDVTLRFPRTEQFGMVSQMREAAISIAANLAEGCGRNTDLEIARFARVALGSAAELEYYIFLSGELGYLDAETEKRLARELAEIKPMLTSLSRYLNQAGRARKQKVGRNPPVPVD